jgi:hypothetical protein
MCSTTAHVDACSTAAYASAPAALSRRPGAADDRRIKGHATILWSNGGGLARVVMRSNVASDDPSESLRFAATHESGSGHFFPDPAHVPQKRESVFRKML